MLQETVYVYIGHITPANSMGSNMIDIIMERLNGKEIMKNYLVAIGCDGSNINIGVDNKDIRWMEVSLECPILLIYLYETYK